MSEPTSVTSRDGKSLPDDASNKQFDEILRDPTKKALLLQKMGFPNPWIQPPLLTPSGMSVGDGAAGLTPSGTTGGSGMGTPPWMHMPFFPPFLAPWAVPPGMTPLCSNNATQAESSRLEEDVVELLSDSEAREFEDFDPSVEPEGTWEPSTAMKSFLERHFNRVLKDCEKDAIMSEFPKPNCVVLQVPQLDDLVRDQLRKKGKDPHFGAERTLYNVQEQLLDVSGPLTCLWADLANPEVEPSAEQILLLLQRTLVLLGSTSHYISQERRKIACSRVNPKLKPVALEEFADREDKLFGPGFLDKASKRLESEKAIDKVSDEASSRKRSFQTNDNTDLRRFLSKGAPANHGGRKIQHLTQPCPQQKQQYRPHKPQAPSKGPKGHPQRPRNPRNKY